MLRTTLMTVLAVVMLPLPALAGTDVIDPAAGDVVDLGEDRNSRMTVPVSIGGKGPYAFIVDTGSERTVLSRELALTLGLSPSGVAEVHSVGGIGRVETVAGDALSVSKTSARDLVAPLLKQSHLGAPGILGIDSLQKQRVLLDFKTQTMTVLPSDRRSKVRGNTDEDTIVITARNRLGRLILADARINKRSVAVVIDTGAEHSIGNAELRAHVVGRKRNAFIVPTTVHSVTGETIPADVTLVDSMQLGNLMLTQMPVAFADLRVFKQLGLDRKPAMLLGMNTLRAFRQVSVDFANRQVAFVVPGDSNAETGTRLAALDR